MTKQKIASILSWILFWPAMLVILLAESEKLSKSFKIIIMIAATIIFYTGIILLFNRIEMYNEMQISILTYLIK